MQKEKAVGALAAQRAVLCSKEGAVNFLEDPYGLHSPSVQTELKTWEIT